MPGAGAAEIRATVGAIGASSYWQGFGLVLEAGDTTVNFALERFDGEAGFSTPCGSGLQATLRLGARPMRVPVLSCDRIGDVLPAAGVILRMEVVDDEPGTVLMSYSIDGGASFIDNFDLPLPPFRPLAGGRPGRLFLSGAGLAMIEDLDGDGTACDFCPETFEEDRLDLRPIDGLAGNVDRDSDGVGDPCDPCADYGISNGLDLDTNGNGIGDLCECGDQNGDHTVDVLDILAINAALFGLQPVRPLCDATNDIGCNINDILAVNAKIFGAEAFCGRYPPPAP